MYTYGAGGDLHEFDFLIQILTVKIYLGPELRSKEFFDIQLASLATHILVQLRNHISTENLRDSCHG